MGLIEKAEISSLVRVTEELTGLPTQAADRTVEHTGYTRYEAREASLLSTRDKFAACTCVIPVGGSLTIDLRAIPFTQGPVDFTGLALRAVMVSAFDTNAGEITVAKASTSGYTLPGNASIKVLPGGKRLKVMTSTAAVAAGASNLTVSGTSGDTLVLRMLAATPQGLQLVVIPTARTGLGRIDGGAITQLSQSAADNLLPRGWLERVQIDWANDVSLVGPATWDELAAGEYAAQSPTLKTKLTDLIAWYESKVPGSTARSGYLAPETWQSEWAALLDAGKNRYPLTVVALRPPLTTIQTRTDDGVKIGTISEVDQDPTLATNPRFRTAAAHGLVVNDLVEIIGVSSDYNGIYKVKAVGSTTRFTTEDTYTTAIGTVAAGTFRGLTSKRVNLSNATEASLALEASVTIMAEQVLRHGFNFLWLDELYDTSIGAPDTEKDFMTVNGPWYAALSERLRAVGLRVAWNLPTQLCSKGGVRRAYQQAGTGKAIFETTFPHGLKPGDTFSVTGNPRPELNTTHTVAAFSLGRTLITSTAMTSGSEGLGGVWTFDIAPKLNLIASGDMLTHEGAFQQNYIHRDSFYQKCLNVRALMAQGQAQWHWPRFFSNSAPSSKNIGTSKDNGAGKLRFTFGTDPITFTHDKIGVVGHSVGGWLGAHFVRDFGQYDVNVTSVSNNGGNAQFNCTSAHNVVANDKVRILTGIYAGERTVLSVQSTTAFTINMTYTATATDKVRVFWLDCQTGWSSGTGAGNGGKIIIQRFSRPLLINNITASAGAGTPWRVTCTANHNIFPEASPWVVIYGQSGTFTEGTEYQAAEVAGQPTKLDIVGTSATGSTLFGGLCYDARCDRRFMALLMTILAEADGKFFISNTIGSAMGDWATVPAQLGAPTQAFSESLITYDSLGYPTYMSRTFERGTCWVNPLDRYGGFTIT